MPADTLSSTTPWGVRKIGTTRIVRRFPTCKAAVLWSGRANLGLFARGAAHRYEAVELPAPGRSPTGRLPSIPNLQGIPVRTELGRQIRAAFHGAPGDGEALHA
jgi:hypothetical protein